MKMYVILGILISFFSSMNSQNIKDYQWENRLVIAFSQNMESEDFQQQLKIFEKDKEAFKERKLVLIQAIPGKIREVFPKESDWKESDFYKKEKSSKTEFEVVLIGLDGGIKLRQNEILQTEKLFSLIDSMPMRRAEMCRDKN